MLAALGSSIVMCLGVTLCAASPPAKSPAGAVTKGPFTAAELKQFVALNAIDTHTHMYHVSPAFNQLIDRLNLHLIDILVVDNHGKATSLVQERAAAMGVIDQNPNRMKLCTTFDPYKFGDAGFAEIAIRQMNEDFANGAIAVKIWKNIGMQIKNAKGEYILPDDPALAPIYQDIADHNRTLIAHVADPDTLWAPPNPKADDYDYYMFEEPWWYMYNKSGTKSKQDLLKARDHIMEMHRTLRVVGAHLGSLEADVRDLGAHFDRYPNFAVDLAGRVPYFQMMPRDEAIAFITRYQDRLIYATDNDHDFYPARDIAKVSMFWETAYANQWRYFATNDIVQYQGKKVQGLALAPEILRKLYHDNAVKWFPGVLGSAK